MTEHLCASSINNVWNSQVKYNHLVWSVWFIAGGGKKKKKKKMRAALLLREASVFVWALRCIHAWPYADLCLRWSVIPIKREYAREGIDRPHRRFAQYRPHRCLLNIQQIHVKWKCRPNVCVHVCVCVRERERERLSRGREWEER